MNYDLLHLSLSPRPRPPTSAVSGQRSLARDRVDHHGGEQAGLVAAIAPAVVDALDDHRVSRFQQDLSLVEEGVNLAAGNGSDLAGFGLCPPGGSFPCFSPVHFA